jgi:glucosamine--fructose-6-phosphate aminotransferase (isomerizing)
MPKADHVEATALERQIRSQPEALHEVLTSAQVLDQVGVAAHGLHRARRIWLVGTGTSHHAAEIGAAMILETGRTAHAVSSMDFVDWAPVVDPRDGVVVITHTAETAYALAARAVAFNAGMDVTMITRQGAGFPDAIETVAKESAETYTVSYTTALAALAMLAQQMGARSFSPDTLTDLPEAVATAIDGPGTDGVPEDARVVVITGAGPAGVTAREGALKMREGARVLAEGYDAEYLLHGSAVCLREGDHLITLTPPDADGFVTLLGEAARAEGLGVTDLHEPFPLPLLLAQIPLTVRLQMLVLRLAAARGENPDVVITGAWQGQALWTHGKPVG